MGKPWGMTPLFQVVRPTVVQDAIWDVVRDAQDSGMSVNDFRRECAEAWSQALRDRAEDDAKIWARER